LYGGGFPQLGWQLVGPVAIAAFAFGTAWLAFTLIKVTVGLRAPEAAHTAGLDISGHGMFGYPERFIEVIGAEPEAPISGVEVPITAR